MASNTCDACKFWHGYKENWERDSVPDWVAGWGDCQCSKLGAAMDLPNSGDMAGGQGDDGEPLPTQSKFGCIHWEAKDA